MQASALRHQIYASFADRGRAPSFAELSRWVGSERDTEDLLLALHNEHAIVLQEDRRELRMALPFSATRSPFRVRSGARKWWANCAWDALAIPCAMAMDGEIEARWADSGEPVQLAVRGGELVGQTAGWVHFVIPANRWWDDIVET